MREALDQVRSELGRDAVILATRQVPVRRLVPWGPREVVEITAGIGIATRPVAGPPERRPVAAPIVEAPMMFLSEQERRAAEIIKELQRRGADGPFRAMIDPISDNASHARKARTAAAPDANLLLTKRLDGIERLLADLGRRRTAGDELPAGLQAICGRLLEADVDEPIARELVETLRSVPPDESLDVLSQRIEDELDCSGPITVKRGSRRVVALVGPTGVGKTTTLAKLAANFCVHDRLSVGLVTADIHRIAAVDQLRTYAEIINLPMRVAATADEMRQALQELSSAEVILIDTAGRSPRDAGQMSELQSLLAAAEPDETHLVLSLTAGRKTLASAAGRFRPVSPTAVIATKLDEAEGAGPIIGLARDTRLPLSYLTTGQEVPDDIETAKATHIAGMIVGPRQRAPCGRG